MQLFHVHRDDPSLAHQVEELRVKHRRAGTVGAALDEQIWLHLEQRLLDGPEVEDVLPDRLAEPGDVAEVVGLADELVVKALEDQFVEVLFHDGQRSYQVRI